MCVRERVCVCVVSVCERVKRVIRERVSEMKHYDKLYSASRIIVQLDKLRGSSATSQGSADAG